MLVVYLRGLENEGVLIFSFSFVLKQKKQNSRKGDRVGLLFLGLVLGNGFFLFLLS
jgi:hypothetical protein